MRSIVQLAVLKFSNIIEFKKDMFFLNAPFYVSFSTAIVVGRTEGLFLRRSGIALEKENQNLN
jgi:hypothetical protein